MPSFSHESYLSKPDRFGFRQRLSINALRPPKWNASQYDIYHGMAFSDGFNHDDKHRKIMVAKFLKNTKDNNKSHSLARTHDFASHTVNLSQNMEDMAEKYNYSMESMKAGKRELPGTRRSNRIQFQELQVAEIESVSFWDKKRRKGEFFVFGEKLPDYKVFFDAQRRNDGMMEVGKKRRRARSVNYLDGIPKMKNRLRTFSLRDVDDDVTESTYQDDGEHSCLQAFVHFYFCHKNGETAIDCLRGHYSNESGYTLITPTVHSLSGDFGPKDCGEDGIRRVIDCHRCNAFCEHLPDMKDILNNALSDDVAAEESGAYGNINPDDLRYEERVQPGNIWSSLDSRSWHADIICPPLSLFGQDGQEDTIVSRQCNIPLKGHLWQERVMEERREEYGNPQDIKRTF